MSPYVSVTSFPGSVCSFPRPSSRGLIVASLPQTSSLDAHAQKHVFDTIEQIARPNGDRTKTVIFITHRLATARRADKIAMMEHGVSSTAIVTLLRSHGKRVLPLQTIVEFGTHEELLGRKEGYAALYHASV